MDLDPVRCYRAFVSRDRRFDGRVFCGVVTTGVYCRPVCPVKPAKFENCRYFACAAAAEAAGFRPCMRCRPETAPGTPAWMGTSAIVSRAMRLIVSGALDDEDVEALAACVGVGGRQLRRLFGEHLGASPAEIARARRVHFARNLIDQTDLPFSEIAAAAGFGSVRQFNHAVRGTFRRSPTALRKKRAPLSPSGGLSLRLPFRPPFDWQSLVGFFGPRATRGVEVVTECAYRRTIDLGGQAGHIEVRPADGKAHLVLTAHLNDYERLLEVVDRVRALFDLDSDPREVAAHLRKSSDLRARVGNVPGLRIPGSWHPFEVAVRAVLGQQVTVRAATTLAGRLADKFGKPVDRGPGLTRLFPGAAALANADIEVIGVPRARAEAVRSVARAAVGGLFERDEPGMLEGLLAIKGIGAWTAEYIAMRAFGEPDAFPASDLGIRRALGQKGRPVSACEAERRAEPWRPWRSYAVLHLWRPTAANPASAPGPGHTP
jgi:AraC family transcriptional regulator of adaptative response / DNA-3-methyladenine glycosylase II